MVLHFLKKKFRLYYKNKGYIWNKKRVNKNWIKFFVKLLKGRKVLLGRIKYIYIIFIFIKNKLLTNLLFGLNKYHFDNLVFKLYELSGRKDTFFLFNTKYYVLLIYTYFYSYNIFNYNISQKINKWYLITSNYFFKTYMFYLNVVY